MSDNQKLARAELSAAIARRLCKISYAFDGTARIYRENQQPKADLWDPFVSRDDATQLARWTYSSPFGDAFDLALLEGLNVRGADVSEQRRAFITATAEQITLAACVALGLIAA